MTAALPLPAPSRPWAWPIALAVDRPGYRHTGICLGDGTVVHFWGNRKNSIISRTSIRTFIAGSPRVWALVPQGDSLSPGLSALLALSSVGGGGFDLLQWNCEHFTHVCLTGRKSSPQVKQLLRRPLLTCVTVALSTVLYLGRRVMRNAVDLRLNGCPSALYATSTPTFLLAEIWLGYELVPCFKVPVRIERNSSPNGRSVITRHLWCKGQPSPGTTWRKMSPLATGRQVGWVCFDSDLVFSVIPNTVSAREASQLAPLVTATRAIDWIPSFLRTRLPRGAVHLES